MPFDETQYSRIRAHMVVRFDAIWPGVTIWDLLCGQVMTFPTQNFPSHGHGPEYLFPFDQTFQRDPVGALIEVAEHCH